MYQVVVILELLFAIASVYSQWGGSLFGSSREIHNNNNRKVGKVNLFGDENSYNFKQNSNWKPSINEPFTLTDQDPHSNDEKNFFSGTNNLRPNIKFDTNPNTKLESWYSNDKNNEDRFFAKPKTNKNYKQDFKEAIIDSDDTGQLGEKAKKLFSSSNSPFSSVWNSGSNNAQTFYSNGAKYFTKSENSNRNPNNFFNPSNNLISANTDVGDFNEWQSNKKKIIGSEKNSGIWTKQQPNSENLYNQNWLTNKKNITNYSKNTEPKKWKTSSTIQNPFNNENQGNLNSNQQKDKMSSKKDLSELDTLDENDWYFGSEADFPEIDSYSNINIDVSKLWDFDKNKELRGSKKRKNRETEVNCNCVDITLCNEEDMIVVKEDVEANNWRLINPPKCEKLTEVCCTRPKSKYLPRYENSFEKTPYLLKCGRRTLSENLLENIEDNNIVLDGEFPWTLRLENLRDSSSCGASLIHPQLALTVAHCVTGIRSEDLLIITNSGNLNAEIFQQRNVSKIIIHPSYSKENPRNDIALLVMDKSFNLTDNINIICLPVTNDKWFSNRCIVSGWNSKVASKISLKAQVSFIPQSECQNSLLNTKLWHDYVFHDSFVCATEKRTKNLCLGDEGSAVICPSKKFSNTYLQIGIVSKSLNCDEFGQPGIFTNVLKFLDWINKYIFEVEIYGAINAK